jgi:hypothetical protein
MSADLLDQYERQVEVEFQNERYLVRDNGAVCRMTRASRKRRLDDLWTFGNPDESKGYMRVGSHVVHRIVATAFHEKPSRQHVVDHIDTNRRNNRADNLRWVTRLENLLLNPITLARIVRAYGSLEAFFEDPSATREHDQDFSWMRTVTKEEAEASRKRLLQWAETESDPRGGRIRQWVYDLGKPNESSAAIVRDRQSLTPLAVQRNWTTLNAFPACPESVSADPLGDYVEGLKPGTVFSVSQYGNTLIEEAVGGDGLLAVLCRMSETSVKDWALAKVTVEDGKFVHESMGTFFSLEGAVNAHRRLLGVDPPYGKTIDDFT